MESHPCFETLLHVSQHGKHGYIVKKLSKVSQRRHTILVVFCISGSVVQDNNSNTPINVKREWEWEGVSANPREFDCDMDSQDGDLII